MILGASLILKVPSTENAIEEKDFVPNLWVFIAIESNLLISRKSFYDSFLDNNPDYTTARGKWFLH